MCCMNLYEYYCIVVQTVYIILKTICEVISCYLVNTSMEHEVHQSICILLNQIICINIKSNQIISYHIKSLISTTISSVTTCHCLYAMAMAMLLCEVDLT